MSYPKTLLALALTFFVGGMVLGGEMNHGGHSMAMPGDSTWGEKEDADFLAGMIVHHQGALEMANVVAGKTGDASVDKWSKAILATQQKEIDAMRSILDGLKFQGETAAAAMEKDMRDMAAMRVSHDPDVNFTATMIPHHAGAIEMSVPALVNSKDARIRKLAEDIIVAQAREIAEFRNWLDKKQP